MDMRQRIPITMEDLMKVWNDQKACDCNSKSRGIIEFLEELDRKANLSHCMKAGMTIVLPSVEHLIAAFVAIRILDTSKDVALIVPVEGEEPWYINYQKSFKS